MLTLDPNSYASEDMQQAVEIYNQHIKNKTEPSKIELEENAFLACVHLIYLIDAKEAKLKTRHDWMDLEGATRPLITTALQHREETLILRPLLNLIKAWIHYKIHALTPNDQSYLERANGYFELALKQEFKVEDPISAGMVHHLAVLMTPDMSNKPVMLDRLRIAIEKGFDYAKFAFSSGMSQFALQLINKKKILDQSVVAIGLHEYSLSQIISTEFILEEDEDDQAQTIKDLFRSATLCHYYLALRYLAEGRMELAIPELRKIVQEGESRVLCHIRKNDTAEVQSIKHFWKDLLNNDYVSFRNKIYNALVNYNRTNKPGRFALRNEMLRVMIEIDSQTDIDDDVKIKNAFQSLLPLIIRIAGTDLSVNQKRGLKSANSIFVPAKLSDYAVAESLSELAKELVQIIVEKGGIGVMPDAVNVISSEEIMSFSLNAEFDEKIARNAIIRFIDDCQRDLIKRNLDHELFMECKLENDKYVGKNTKSPAHSLLFLAKLEYELSKSIVDQNQLKEIVAKTEREYYLIADEQHDPLLILWNIVQHERFQLLVQNSMINDNESLLYFDRVNRLNTKCEGKEREAIVCYLLALVLFSKQQYELGARYFAKSFSLGDESPLFNQVDNGLARRFFCDRNWYTFSHLFVASLSQYAEGTDRSKLKTLRRDYAKEIVRNVMDIDADETINDQQKILKFKESVLPMLLFLAGINLGATQRMALKRKSLKIGNLCKASKDGLNLAIQLLGITPTEFEHALNRCLAKASDNPKDTALGLDACKTYFKDLYSKLQTQFDDKRQLEWKCYPYLALAIGEFAWQPKQIPQIVQKTFLRADVIPPIPVAPAEEGDDEEESTEAASEVFVSLPLTPETKNALGSRREMFFAQSVLPPPPAAAPDWVAPNNN